MMGSKAMLIDELYGHAENIVMENILGVFSRKFVYENCTENERENILERSIRSAAKNVLPKGLTHRDRDIQFATVIKDKILKYLPREFKRISELELRDKFKNIIEKYFDNIYSEYAAESNELGFYEDLENNVARFANKSIDPCNKFVKIKYDFIECGKIVEEYLYILSFRNNEWQNIGVLNNSKKTRMDLRAIEKLDRHVLSAKRVPVIKIECYLEEQNKITHKVTHF